MKVESASANNSGEIVSEIRNYFDGATVLLTGVTGSVGKLILEKLLRSCCGVKKIYLLVREKNKKPPGERLDKLFEEHVFGPLKEQRPDFRRKLSVCVGDCLLPDLGLSSEDLDLLKNEVNCVLHCAATVRFDASLRDAAYINVRASRYLLHVAKEFGGLTSFVYVSTAYSHCPRKIIGEVFYESPMSAKNLIHLVDALDDDTLNAVTARVIGKWPNTYSFTKAVAESVMATEAGDLPLTVVRASIISGSFREPIPGWMDNMFGYNGQLLAAAFGLKRVSHITGECVCDVVPSDYVVNATLAAAWCVNRKKSPVPVIYNCVSGPRNPITWGYNLKSMRAAYDSVPFLGEIWYSFTIVTGNILLYTMLEFFLHTVPAYVGDFVLLCSGKKTGLVALFKKMSKYADVLEYFMNNEWHFEDENMQSLWKTMKPADRELFQFNVESIDWEEYNAVYVRGLRQYLANDPLETIPRARRRHFLLKIGHYVLVSTLLFLFFYFLFVIVF